MSYSRSSVDLLLSALASFDLHSLTPLDIGCIRAAADAVARSYEPLTVAEATGRHAHIVRLVRERKLEEARIVAHQLHRDAMLAIDRLPLGSLEAIAIAGIALKSIEVI